LEREASAERLTADSAMHYALDAMFTGHHHAHRFGRHEAGRV
jgi:hypothetical protein